MSFSYIMFIIYLLVCLCMYLVSLHESNKMFEGNKVFEGGGSREQERGGKASLETSPPPPDVNNKKVWGGMGIQFMDICNETEQPFYSFLFHS